MDKREIKAKTTFIRLPEVIKRTGFGKTWIYELIKTGRFPSQVKTGIRAVAFIESEIDEWIDATIRNSRQNAA
ncbi:AlpA family transcriptional regulator [Salmonella enterica subsp. enterica serovar Putten]|uniref:AlpA family transcriptional regulator n=2 Tax=Salmonella enterica TaxID=28901 RepID=A0A5U3HA44_SALER|nr:AlpA family transcriptional regulator [Salmonella enterica]EBE9591015.1 AlpA family transcriptional regulator [Salmonella enterica subsp. enterica serovar Infantis]EBY6677886.1 AlpA family transcriptional regulator [Salmonella enterica subsp. enterica serovar Saphra]ECE5874388.1 AlpA family transcriptional regulator [Salmonella enterica subsp. enterica]EDU5099654.1 AlpA family transcriptional regulator [Salmonella enterica subsp. enterica serovar Worthington]EAM8282647.1 AlpA family transcr